MFHSSPNTDALEVAIDKSVELQVRNIFDIVKREDS